MLDRTASLVTITSSGTQKRRIIGGIRVEGWQSDVFNGHECLSAAIPTDPKGALLPFTDLFVNGHRAKTTRFPKVGNLKLVSTEEQESGHVFPKHRSCDAGSSRYFLVNPDDLASVQNIEDATIHYYHYWIDEHSPIQSYDAKTGKLTMLLHSRFSCNALYEENHTGCTVYYLTGVPNTFCEAGEWYADRANGKIYYIPENESVKPDTIEAIIPTTDRLFEIESEDIVLENLELFVTSGDYASTAWTEAFRDKPDFVGVGGDIQSVCWAPGAITFRAADRCAIRGCHLHGLGIHAVEIAPSCRRIRIENNEIDDICAGGVKIEGGHDADDLARVTSDCVVRGNHIHHCGKRYQAGCGILAMHASNLDLCDNEIHDLEYSGISVGWIWGYAPSATYGNRICGNHIYNIGKGNLSDMGGIYTLGAQRGTVIADNRIHNIRCKTYGAWGIYLDEGSGQITVERNVVYGAQTECLHLHYGQNNVVKNNVFFNDIGNHCIRVSKYEYHEQISFEQNLLISNDKPFYFYRGHTLGASHNLLWSPSQKLPMLYEFVDGPIYSLSEWQTMFGNDRGSVFADPKIEKLAEYDFTLAEDSPAFALGFIPLSDRVCKPE